MLRTPRPTRRAYFLWALPVLCLITLATHGPALWDGKVLDDFWHQRGLRLHGWSFSELMRTLIIAPADFLHTWWQTKPVVWHYFRPLFILCMKFTFIVLGGGDPMSLHALSITLHLISVLLVWRICWALTGHETWSLIGGLLFAIYPHSVITVAWPSSQNVVMQTTLLLGALWAFMRTLAPPQPGRRPSVGFQLLAYFLWLLAILTRENAVLFPAVFLALDWTIAGRRSAWAKKNLYLGFAIAGLALVICRESLKIPPLPEVYCRRPAGDWAEYMPWLAAKFLHYVCASVWIAPMTIGPTGRYAPWTSSTGDCLLMVAIVLTLGTIYRKAARSEPTWWVWPLWIVLSILPVTAVVATPHSGYMCGVGWAIAAALAPAAAERRGSRSFARIAAATTLLLTLGAAFFTPVNRLQWVGIYSAERHLPEWVRTNPPPPKTQDIFFINMPFVNIYAKPNLVDRLGPAAEAMNVHVLTYAPEPLAMTEPTRIQRVADNAFEVSAVGRPFFSGLLGRFALEAFGGRGRFQAGEHVECNGIAADIIEADERGVRRIRFTFPRSLSDPRYCFYLSTPQCGAALVRFDRSWGILSENAVAISNAVQLETAVAELEAGRLWSVDRLIATARDARDPLSSRAESALRRVIGYMAGALGSSIQDLFRQPRLMSDDWERIGAWCRTALHPEDLREVWLHRHDFDDLVYLRYEIEWDRGIAARFIRSDLYLSGPPFDDPRP